MTTDSTTNHFTVVQGDDKDAVITITDPSGNAVDVTGATIVFDARRSLRGTAVISKSTSSGIVLTTPASGIITVTLTDSDTDITPGDYFYRVVVTFSDGTIATVLRDVLTIEPSPA